MASLNLVFNHRIITLVKQIVATCKVHYDAEDQEECYGACEQGAGLHLEKYVDESVEACNCACEGQG